ncbi:DUF481 domain-containing protein [Horticoccus luteus]|uniref:DUF481 domain-containing protein n=1 Tax=Horticoccus luteus TaxID=2862869 RepID=UPI002106C2E2|nr:DUF481 domain-containing protein [Horticoccus luteus]
METRSGARLIGTITKIDAGVITLKTDYAGDLSVKQSEVVGITTNAPLVVRLASGTTLEGRVTSEGGAMKIAGPDGELTTKVDKVAATWSPGGTDPQVAALQRHWTYEAAVDMTGKTGNTEQLGTQVSGRAVLKTPQDTLQFYTAYNRQVSEGVKSADQFKAGVDYANNFSGKRSWYMRDEGGFDRVKDVELYNVAAAGIGYDFVKQPKHIFTGRIGLSYRYEGYSNPLTANVSSAGLDLGIYHEYQFANSKLVNRLAFVPSFNDFSNFRLTHESYYELPILAPAGSHAWALRLGVSNDYNSKPGVDVEKLDTMYFTRLVLSWQ